MAHGAATATAGHVLKRDFVHQTLIGQQPSGGSRCAVEPAAGACWDEEVQVFPEGGADEKE
jgi:hypothetical protein